MLMNINYLKRKIGTVASSFNASQSNEAYAKCVNFLFFATQPRFGVLLPSTKVRIKCWKKHFGCQKWK